MKNKIFLSITTIIFVLALIVAIFQVEKYDFITQMKLASNIEFENPLTQFTQITSYFDVPSDAEWWNAIFIYVQGIFKILFIPIDIIRILIADIMNGLKYILTILGIVS